MDYTLHFLVVCELASATSKTVTDQCRAIFFEYSIPPELTSNNSSCYASEEFPQFAKKYNFKHTTTSPHYHESIGLAMKFVGIVKDILQKAKESGQDPNKAILNYRRITLSN